MSTVVNRYSLDPLYERDVANYPIEHYWHDPDLTAVVDVEPIYWKETVGVFSEMTQPEKDAKDAFLTAANINRDKKEAKREVDDSVILRPFAEVVMDEINILRALHGLPARTLSQLVDAIKAKIDAQ